jgi:hypothetical protein
MLRNPSSAMVDNSEEFPYAVPFWTMVSKKETVFCKSAGVARELRFRKHTTGFALFIDQVDIRQVESMIELT